MEILVALANQDNDYKRAQADMAEEAARSSGATARIFFAMETRSSRVSNSQLRAISVSSLRHIRSYRSPRRGTELHTVAQATAAAGVGWGVLRRHVDYLSNLREKYSVPLFEPTSNHAEEGQLQGKQLAALVPNGGRVLHIVGPSTDSVSQQRLIGMGEPKPENVQLLAIRGNWRRESGYKAVSSWWNLPTSRQRSIVAIVAQNDAMALGGRKALQELGEDRLSNLPVIGCDGFPNRAKHG